MGIQGLIPFLENSSRPINIAEFSGCTVAVDAYCWLHKGAFSCAEKLARGEKCDAYVYYCMKFIYMLLSHNIKPILVFDGQHLPAKADTEKKRRESRELNRRRAAELLRQDKPNEARTYIRRCVDITHSMALELMHACRAHNVDCITAPYEADSQLAYLNLSGIAHLVITEDSDLILFGCKKVVFKMDQNGGGLLVEQEMLHRSMKVRQENYSFEKFRRMCILSGCDYLPSLPGIGLTKACKFITRTSDPDIHKALTRLSSHLNMPQITVTQDYRDRFVHSEAMFQHQPVFDPISRKVVPLTPLQEGTPPLGLPEQLPDDQAYQLALGNLDPFTLKVVDNWDPTKKEVTNTKTWGRTRKAPHPSIWMVGYQSSKPKLMTLKARLPQSTSGKQSLQNPNLLQTPPSNLLDDNEVEAILMDSDKNQGETPPPSKKFCVRDETNTSNIDEENRKSPILSSTEKADIKSKFLSKFKRFRNTVIDDKCQVKSRYFNNISPKVENLTASTEIISHSDEEKLDCEMRLKDLSNTVTNTETKRTPKKMSPLSDGIENYEDPLKHRIKRLSPKKLNMESENVVSADLSSGDDKDFDSGILCPNSLELETSSQSSDKSTGRNNNDNSLFKWKQSLHERFGYAQGSEKTESMKSVNNSFQNPLNKSGSAIDQTTPVQNNSKGGPLSSGKKANPFRISSAKAALSSAKNFNLLRDPVPKQYTNQEVEDQILSLTPSPVKNIVPPKDSSLQTSKGNTSSSKCRTIGLSKKASTSTPSADKSQKNLLSMFLLQPKPKVQCK